MNRDQQQPAQNEEQDIQDLQRAIQLTDQRRVYRRRAKPIGELLNHLIIRCGIAAEKSQDELNNRWQLAVGPAYAGQTRVGKLRRGILEIWVLHSSLLQELVFAKDDYLQQLNQTPNTTKIRDLRFRIGGV